MLVKLSKEEEAKLDKSFVKLRSLVFAKKIKEKKKKGTKIMLVDELLNDQDRNLSWSHKDSIMITMKVSQCIELYKNQYITSGQGTSLSDEEALCEFILEKEAFISELGPFESNLQSYSLKTIKDHEVKEVNLISIDELIHQYLIASPSMGVKFELCINGHSVFWK